MKIDLQPTVCRKPICTPKKPNGSHIIAQRMPLVCEKIKSSKLLASKLRRMHLDPAVPGVFELPFLVVV